MNYQLITLHNGDIMGGITLRVDTTGNLLDKIAALIQQGDPAAEWIDFTPAEETTAGKIAADFAFASAEIGR